MGPVYYCFQHIIVCSNLLRQAKYCVRTCSTFPCRHAVAVQPLLEIKKKCTHKDNHFAKKRHENLMKNKKVQILLVPFSLVYL
jgi:hypothetical protein